MEALFLSFFIAPTLVPTVILRTERLMQGCGGDVGADVGDVLDKATMFRGDVKIGKERCNSRDIYSS